jgi:hypothetical protein
MVRHLPRRQRAASGSGATVRKLATIGLAGFGLWKVTPDKGADVPATLRGGRTRVFGVTSRPRGQVIALSLVHVARSAPRRAP